MLTPLSPNSHNLPAASAKGRIGYVLKMYPRFSETFIVNEILALEALGTDIDIFSLRPPNDGHFHETLAAVKAGVRFVDDHQPKSIDLWNTLHAAAAELPGLWPTVSAAGEFEVRDVYQAVHLACQAKRNGITHLHAHFANVATNVAQLAARMAGISYSFTAHAKDIFHEEVNQNRLREQIREASHVITVSDFNHRHLSSLCPDSSNRIHRIYNGLELRTYPFSPLSGREDRIIAVGRLVEKKGFEVLIDACGILRNSGEPIPCRIVGVGALATTLQWQIDELNLNDLVSLEGAMTHGRIIEAVSSASMFAAPCVVASDGNRDGLPTVLLEAMALGTPCISTDVTGIPELLRHERTGLCVPQRDPAALAGAIRRLRAEPELAARLAVDARQRIEEDFDIGRTSRNIAALHQRQAVQGPASSEAEH